MIDHPTQGVKGSKPGFRPKGKMDELTREAQQNNKLLM